MGHYLAFVLIESPEDVESQVEQIMEPFTGWAKEAFCDWWQMDESVAVDYRLVPVTTCPDELGCFTLIAGDNVFHIQDMIDGVWSFTGFDGLVLGKLRELDIRTGYLAAVDYHV